MTVPPSEMDQPPRVAVWGAGYIGLTSAFSLLQAGYSCVLIDISQERLGRIAEGRHPLAGFEDRVPFNFEALKVGTLVVSTPDNTAVIGACESHVIAVNTETASGIPDDGALMDVLSMIAITRRSHQTLVAIESTIDQAWLGYDPDATGLAVLLDRDCPASGLDVRPLGIVASRVDTCHRVRHPGGIGGSWHAVFRCSAEVSSGLPTAGTPLSVWTVENLLRFTHLTLVNQLAMAYPDVDMAEVLKAFRNEVEYAHIPPVPGDRRVVHPALAPFRAAECASQRKTQSRSFDPRLTGRERIRHSPAQFINEVSTGLVVVLGISYAAKLKVRSGWAAAELARELLAAGADCLVSDPYFTDEEIYELTRCRPFDVDQVVPARRDSGGRDTA